MAGEMRENWRAKWKEKEQKNGRMEGGTERKKGRINEGKKRGERTRGRMTKGRTGGETEGREDEGNKGNGRMEG